MIVLVAAVDPVAAAQAAAASRRGESAQRAAVLRQCRARLHLARGMAAAPLHDVSRPPGLLAQHRARDVARGDRRRCARRQTGCCREPGAARARRRARGASSTGACCVAALLARCSRRRWHASLFVRAAIAVAFIAPIGFALGQPFVAGLGWLRRTRAGARALVHRHQRILFGDRFGVRGPVIDGHRLQRRAVCRRSAIRGSHALCRDAASCLSAGLSALD